MFSVKYINIYINLHNSIVETNLRFYGTLIATHCPFRPLLCLQARWAVEYLHMPVIQRSLFRIVHVCVWPIIPHKWLDMNWTVYMITSYFISFDVKYYVHDIPSFFVKIYLQNISWYIIYHVSKYRVLYTRCTLYNKLKLNIDKVVLKLSPFNLFKYVLYFA